MKSGKPFKSECSGCKWVLKAKSGAELIKLCLGHARRCRFKPHITFRKI